MLSTSLKYHIDVSIQLWLWTSQQHHYDVTYQNYYANACISAPIWLKFCHLLHLIFSRLFHLTVFQLVSVTEIRIPLTEIRIPLTENRIPLTTTKIPLTKIRIPLTEFKIPIIEIIYNTSNRN